MFIKALEDKFVKRAERYAYVRELRNSVFFDSVVHAALIMRRTPAMRKEASWRETYKGDRSLTRQERAADWSFREQISEI